MNGEILPADHGFPARVVVSGWLGAASIKWLARIEVSQEPLYVPWNTEDYVLIGPDYPSDGPARGPAITTLPAAALTELPWPARLRPEPQMIRGRAFAGEDRGRRRRVPHRRRPLAAGRPALPRDTGRLGAAQLGGNPEPQHMVARVRATDELPPHPGARYSGGAQVGEAPRAVVDPPLDRGHAMLTGVGPAADQLRFGSQPGRPRQFDQAGNRQGGDRGPAGAPVRRANPVRSGRSPRCSTAPQGSARTTSIRPSHLMLAAPSQPETTSRAGNPWSGGSGLAVHRDRDDRVVGPRFGQRKWAAGPDGVERLRHHLPRAGR